MAARVLDLAGTAMEKAEPVTTDFLNPGEKKLLLDLLHFVGEIKCEYLAVTPGERVGWFCCRILPSGAVITPLAYLEVKAKTRKIFNRPTATC